MSHDRQLTPKINFYFHNSLKIQEKSQNILSKPSIIFFKLLHVFMGFDFGFFCYKSFRIKSIFKTVSVIQCLALTLTSCTIAFLGCTGLNHECVDAVFVTVYASQFLLCMVALLLANNKISLCNFLNELQCIDWRLQIDRTFATDFKIGLALLYCGFFVVFSINSHCAKGALCSHIFIKITLILYLFTIHVSHIVNSLVFHLINKRLKKLEQALKEAKNTNTGVSTFHHIICKDLVDLSEKIKQSFDFLVIKLITIVKYIPPICKHQDSIA